MNILEFLYETLNKNTIVENTLCEIKSLIKEEQGISVNVIKYTNLICDKIENEIKIAEKRIVKNMVSFKSNYFDYKIWNGENVRIRWYYYNFYDKQTYFKEINNINKIDKFTEYDPINYESIKTISVTILSVSGVIQNITLYDTISHELAHYNKFNKANKNFSNENLYQFVRILMSNFNNKTLIGSLARIIYHSKEYENDAYNHGLYSWLMNYQTETMDDALKNSELFSVVIYLKNVVENLKSIDDELPSLKDSLNLFKKYKLDKKDFIRIGEKTINKINRLIARTYYKAKNDYLKNNKETVHEHYGIPQVFLKEKRRF